MQNDVLSPIPTGKVYKVQSIIIATFFGGMFAAAFLLAGNFRTFEQRRKLVSVWVYAVVLFLLLGLISFVPELDKVPGIVYSIVITAIIAAYTNAQQKDLIEEHIKNGGEVHSGGRVFVVTLIGIILMVAFVLFTLWLADTYYSPEVELQNY